MLELKNVSYEVNEDQREIEILKNINLKIEERFVAITGPNGGGKSTLAKIIAGILVPTSGQILLDGEDITGMNITERAKAGISFAFQQPVRFKGITVRDLITLAAGKNLTTAEACSYLSEVGLCAQEYINREVNASLSGGERQRISIARCILKDAPIVILDEATASVDADNESYIQEAITQLCRGKTLLVIAHRLNTIRHADEILVIDQGRIVQAGAHDTLMEEEGIYRRFITARSNPTGWCR